MGTSYYTYAGSLRIYFSSEHSHVWVSPFPFGVPSFVLLRSLNSNFLTYSLPAIIVWLKIDQTKRGVLDNLLILNHPVLVICNYFCDLFSGYKHIFFYKNFIHVILLSSYYR
jgi:hypothetical protein